MDKKSILGLVIIGTILIAFTWYNNNQVAKFNEQKAIVDSIAAANAPKPIIALQNESVIESLDSVSAPVDAQLEQHLGNFLYEASRSEEQFYSVENEVMKIKFSSKGGRVASVEIKDYKTYNGNPLMLFEEGSSIFDLSFFIKQGYNNIQINTSEYNFKPIDLNSLTFSDGQDKKSITMRLEIDSTSYIDYVYTILKDNYMIDFDVRFEGMESSIAQNQSDMEILWSNIGLQNEKGFENENNNTSIDYNFPGEEGVEELGMSKAGVSKSESINTKIKWVAFKQQYFTSAIIAKNDFQNGNVEYNTFQPGDGKIKKFMAKLSVPFSSQTSEYNFQFYFGPNKFSILKEYDINLQKLIPLGWGIFGWINRWLVIPTFDILSQYISSYGLIILILTILIKLLIAPLTYKSYLSMAKIRLLKPDIDAINLKYPKSEDALKKQQATMAVYKSAGANPMGGCLPMLIQFPVLIAMFRFFPASIELRGERFLWADDLSSYDSILNLPFDIPFYGDHVSLFTLLMAVSLFITSKISYSQTASNGPQMPGMKFMTLYMMPVMMVFWFNNFSSGLSYYYLVSNIFTIGQTYAFRYAIDDKKLHQQMKDNAKKPQKKSKWQARYDDMIKQQQTRAGKK